MFRVVSGAVKADSTVHNKGKDAPERLGHLMLMQGKTATNVPEIKAGDLGAVAKLKDTLTNDVLGDKADPVTFPPIQFPEPVLAYAIEPKSRGDEDKISTSMHRLEEEDPVDPLQPRPADQGAAARRPGTAAHRGDGREAERRFSVDVNLKPPRIPYRETIKASTEAHGRHKKQTGGPRPVRRLQDQGRAAGPRRRLRVRRRHLRRLDPAPVRPGGGERASRTRGRAATWPATRWSTSA
jgi:elongation factor G